MTIKKLNSDRYHRRHARGGGYPVFKMTCYDLINFIGHLTNTTLKLVALEIFRARSAFALDLGHRIRRYFER